MDQNTAKGAYLKEEINEINCSQAFLGSSPQVNLANGGLRYALDSVSVGYGNYAIDVSLIYNSKLNETFAKKIAGFGRNWKLNLTQIILFDNCDAEGRKIYKYLDSAGDVHRFIEFDTNRYYDERNAKVVLTQSSEGYVLTDGVGNELRFDAEGYLVESVSCQNTQIKKEYVYDETRRLIEVFDARSQKRGGAAKNRIELSYENGLLRQMTAVSNFSVKVSALRFGYDAYGNLTSAEEIAFNRSSQECLSKRVIELAYKSGLLSEILFCESNLATKISYENGRVSQLSDGAVREISLPLGLQGKSGDCFLYCGNSLSETKFKSKFTEKARSSFKYVFLNASDELAAETDVTNMYDVTLAYFLDRSARVVSSFERDGENLKTLSLQREQKWNNFTGDASETINGVGVMRFKSSGVPFSGIAYEIARNKAEKTCRRFGYSFWLKTNKVCSLLEAKIVCTFREGDDSSTDMSQHSVKTVGTAALDSEAVGVWQKVTLPFAVPENLETDCFKTLDITLVADKTEEIADFETIDIGFAPMPQSEMFLYDALTNVPLSNMKSAAVNLQPMEICKDLYFTESDIIATYANRKGKGCCDVICNNGTKRIANARSLQFVFPFAPQNITVDASKNKPFYITTLLPAGGASVRSAYDFGETSFTVENVYKKTVDDVQYTSSSSIETSYKGNVLSQTDEYGTKVNYSYDNFGNLTKKTVTDGGGETESVENYSYDSEGRLESANNGAAGNKISYGEKDEITSVCETSRSSENVFAETPHSVNEKYGVYHGKVLSAREFDGNILAYENKLTYENGALRTVSDGAAKYGAVQDHETNKTYYTAFDGETETIVQRDSAHLTFDYYGDEYQYKYYKTNNVSEFYDTEGNKTGSSNAVVDCYGKTQSQTRNYGTSKDSFDYSYDEIAESKFASKPASCRKLAANERTLFRYDVEGNLVGWQEKEETNGEEQTVFEVCQIASDTTKYTFDPKEDYFTSVIYDKEKTAAPRVTSVQILQDFSDTKDRPEDLYKIYYEQFKYGRSTKKVTGTGSITDYSYEVRNSVPELRKIDYSHILMRGRKCKLEDSFSYYDNGLLKMETVRYTEFADHDSDSEIQVDVLYSKGYKYDNLHRVTQEINPKLNVNRTYEYNPSGRIKKIVNKDGETKNFGYDGRGRLIYVNNVRYSYDNYGNRTERNNEYGEKVTYKYGCGGMLLKAGDTEYKYNSDGARYKKIRNGETAARYYLDGNKILGEDRQNCQLRYFYDMDGLVLIRHTVGKMSYDYEVVNDGNGNVSMLIRKDTSQVVCRYEYDIFGNCHVITPDGYTITDEESIAHINPFRWKGFYWDTESNLYYANGSYYDPETGLYVDASPVYSVFENALNTRCIDRNGILCDNILELAGSPFTAYPTHELSADPEYDPGKTWYEKFFDWWNNIPKWIKIGIGLIVIVVLALVTLWTGGISGGVLGYIFAHALEESVKEALTGTVISGFIGGIFSAIRNNDFASGFFNGAVDGFMFGSITGGIIGAVRGYKEVASVAKYWARGTSKRTSTPMKTLGHHYKRHVIEEGYMEGNNVIKYTYDAVNFANRNAAALKFRVPYDVGLQPNWSFLGKHGMNGEFASSGKILTFWYKTL